MVAPTHVKEQKVEAIFIMPQKFADFNGDENKTKQSRSNDDANETTPGIVEWPRPIDERGMHGIAGEFVRMVMPHTQADPNAILLTFLTFCGNHMGRKYFMWGGAKKHVGNLFLCLVGGSGTGQKGEAMNVVESFFKEGKPPNMGHIHHGISTGEGVIDLVHDAYLGDPAVRDFRLRENPAAARAIAARLDAARRNGLWHPRRNDFDAVLAAMLVEAT